MKPARPLRRACCSSLATALSIGAALGCSGSSLQGRKTEIGDFAIDTGDCVGELFGRPPFNFASAEDPALLVRVLADYPKSTVLDPDPPLDGRVEIFRFDGSLRPPLVLMREDCRIFRFRFGGLGKKDLSFELDCATPGGGRVTGSGYVESGKNVGCHRATDSGPLSRRDERSMKTENLTPFLFGAKITSRWPPRAR